METNTGPLILGKAHGLANQPYFNNMKYFGANMAMPASAGVLADLILRGKMIAGPVTPLDFVRLRAEGCRPLADFSVYINPYIAYDSGNDDSDKAALIHAPFVLLVKKPIEEYDFLRVGVSQEILSCGTESLLLTKLLLSVYWEIEHKISFELSLDDDAWLCQGGPYLISRSKQFFGFSYAYDLVWEWFRWKKAPYILSRWVCGPDADDDVMDELTVSVRRTLELNLRNLATLAHCEAGAKGLERGEILSYLQGFGFRLGLWQKPAESVLRDLTGLLKESELAAFP
ncbi:MAG: hypothetical protein HY747_07745 [Elusimicrobia bacterium]|nr:hypothetical protein [Elusimicrobiota bacterium]